MSKHWSTYTIKGLLKKLQFAGHWMADENKRKQHKMGRGGKPCSVGASGCSQGPCAWCGRRDGARDAPAQRAHERVATAA